ncbi:hypothetical protein [Undibacterium flavidum]|uniref:Uncharacterized protein n=1 Tax=Undibacterium flavidum TaxID=2762297 RepID=A0ABR6YG63_9BURK|nr:hypothetical protein [Undibacterium flavidum]MBC3875533.1 hypothetical protein [Undibacterium flavidum]
MARKLIIILCAIGIAYYSTQIWGLKDRISLTRSAPKANAQITQRMQFQFTMESTNVELIEACRQLFRSDDQMLLSVDPKETSKAILKVQRSYLTSSLPEILDLNKQLKAKGCLLKDSDVFAIKTLP